jgi:pyruvate/2-oxoglutarate dehydrogenase complex dihydrolipoamide acyltransferase (E2) component
MQLLRKVLVVVLAVLMGAPSVAADERHVLDRAALAAAVAGRAARQDADRAAVHEALARPEVRDLASRMGVDLNRAGAVVDTLSDAELVRAAGAARQINEQLVGGQGSVTFTTTTIIIALLIVILIIVAVD